MGHERIYTREGDDGTTLAMRVVEVHETHVTVDANHPLAGETLNFQVRVVEVHPATDDEVLAAEGVTDFDRYAVTPGAELLPDFFVPEKNSPYLVRAKP